MVSSPPADHFPLRGGLAVCKAEALYSSFLASSIYTKYATSRRTKTACNQRRDLTWHVPLLRLHGGADGRLTGPSHPHAGRLAARNHCPLQLHNSSVQHVAECHLAPTPAMLLHPSLPLEPATNRPTDRQTGRVGQCRKKPVGPNKVPILLLILGRLQSTLLFRLMHSALRGRLLRQYVSHVPCPTCRYSLPLPTLNLSSSLDSHVDFVCLDV